MFSIFPSDWQAPKPNWMNKQSNQPNWISKPTPVPKAKPTKPISLNELNKKVKNLMPDCEMCYGENFDFTEVERMLAAMDNPSYDSDDGKVIEAITKILSNIDHNIQVLEEGIDVKDGITRVELLGLLKTFAESYRDIIEYLKQRVKEEKQ